MSSPVPAPRRTDPMRLLADGVPLSLLMDLVLGPRSEDLLAHEPLLPADADDHLTGAASRG